MRSTRTPVESLVVERLIPHLLELGIQDPVLDPYITDAPDAVIRHAKGKIGVEISRLDYERYCKWLANSPESPYSRAAEVSINLRKLLATAIRKKRQKYDRYIQTRQLSECWLVLHNNLFEFPETGEPGRPDRKWFESHGTWELQDQQCPFDRVLFNLEHPNRWYMLFRKGLIQPRLASTNRWPSIIFYEAVLKTTLGVNAIDFRDKPDRPFFR